MTCKDKRYIRWHDSGDLQGKWHLDNILEVARRTPHVNHWLPSKEYALAREALKTGLPPNVTLRVSYPTVVSEMPRHLAFPHMTLTSTRPIDGAFNCPAPQQGNKCADCRACWDKRVRVVAIQEH